MGVAHWRPAYIAIGSNLHTPKEQVYRAMALLAQLPVTRLLLSSALYSTRPMGPQEQPEFVNAVVGMLTQRSAVDLLAALHEVERIMGRERRERWGPRIIDLDLLWLVGEPVDQPGLQVPHPGVSERNFVLYPLADIAPQLNIPGHGLIAALKSRISGEGIAWLERSRHVIE